MRFIRREPSARRRPVVQRAVFICDHPFFPQERMLSQELFRPRVFAEHRLARNECPVPGNLRQTANHAIAHVFGHCDFIRLVDVGSHWRVKTLRPVDVECRIMRISVDPAHEWILHRVLPKDWVEVPECLRTTLDRSAEATERVAAE